ncbi:hypothetical protein CXF72_04225 [Psychromonas sp. MB-3u-54]|uniref:DUF2971 domain-containing protein n=1 Tax=Psychromonas sp. MB-3u-54 TaxID=2058319 RepID=UPI000C348DBD|nr:DUF2971 domain-containing protein [Psychromonas sp. MB-3u-54]PKH03789.1 hypothetical protein CXF72_04225 [Psychromonas sp. MB-3u-54]
MKVYKYTPHINQFIESSAMKLTPILQLNDPFEAKLTDGFINNLGIECKKIFKEKYDSIFPGFKDSIQESSRYKGIVSLSRKSSDIIMLSHYASNHEGGILEFEVSSLSDGSNNTTSLFDRLNKGSYNFGDVQYEKKRRLELSDDFDKYLSRDIFFEKYIEWEYEEEVRYASDFRNADSIIISKKSLVKNHFDELNENGDLNIVSWHIEDDCFYHIFESSDFDENEDRLYRSKKKKIRSIVGRIFRENILMTKQVKM